MPTSSPFRIMLEISHLGRFIGVVLALILIGGMAQAQTNRYWDGSKSTNWTTAQNWSGNNVPDSVSEVAVFDSASSNDPAAYGDGITIGGFSLTGGEARTLTFNNTIALGQYGVDNSSTVLLKIAAGTSGSTVLTAAQTWSVTNTGGTIFSKNLINAGFLLGLEATSSGVGTIEGVISGTGGITKSGSGTWKLTGANTYTGETTFAQGVVNVANLTNYGVAGSLGNRLESAEGSGGTANSNIGLHFMGGTLQYTGATAQSTNRNIRVGLAGGTIDASGSNPAATMNFTKSTPNVDIWDSDGARSLTLTGSNTGSNTFAINWQERAAGRSSLVKSGAGTWVLTNSHNSDAQSDAYSTYGGYGGGTTLAAGTLGFTNNAIGGGVVNFTGNATLRWEAGNTQDLTTGSGAGAARSVKIEDGVTATFNTNGNNVTLSNPLSVGTLKTGALSKEGAGTLTLTAANTYTGDTSVRAGELRLANALGVGSDVDVFWGADLNLTGGGKVNGDVRVLGGARLLGTGQITGLATISSGGTHSPGPDFGIQTVQNLTYNSGSIFEWNLAQNTTSPGTPGSMFDQVQVNQNLTVNSGAIFRILLGQPYDQSNPFWQTEQTWDVFNVGTSSGGFTNFQVMSGGSALAGAAGSAFSYSNDGSTGQLHYTPPEGGYTPVPEASNLLAGLLLMAGLLRRRRVQPPQAA